MCRGKYYSAEKPISNDFGGFLELISKFEFDFLRREIYIF